MLSGSLRQIVKLHFGIVVIHIFKVIEFRTVVPRGAQYKRFSSTNTAAIKFFKMYVSRFYCTVRPALSSPGLYFSSDMGSNSQSIAQSSGLYNNVFV